MKNTNLTLNWYQLAPAGHESAETPIGNESNGAVAGEGANFIVILFQINEGPYASTSYECTIMYSAPYRAASDQTPYCATSTNFPWNGKTNGLKRQISNFSAKENEKFYECWERYMEAINACPHHGFDTWLLVSYFYDGMSSSMKQLLETMCGGDFMREVGKMKSQPNALHAKAGMYTLNEDVDMKAKFAAMTRRVEELELKKMHEVQAVAETPVQVKPCSICQSYEHLVEECPTIPVAREMFGEQANVIGQFKPISKQCFVWQYLQLKLEESSKFFMEAKSTSVPTAGSTISTIQQASSLEQAIVNLSKVVGDFVGDQKSINSQLSQRIDSVENTLNKRMDGMQNDLSQKIDNLQYSISRLTNLNTVQEKGRFPSQPHQNPKGIHEVETHEGESSQVRDVKALITLRSGKKVESPTPKPYVEEKEEEETKKREEMKGKKKDISEERRTVIQQ
ncbi:hypothetical protein CK203_055680 [Vitis vinifera]|uniref:Retrotransposon gag domain-containing protein n=1 Tax=Vitis vinifera TaxID=29760 RepID=A0A438FVD4_VITVI|nr:hypothetical protein CK203_055680 [Vitis vinifera]